MLFVGVGHVWVSLVLVDVLFEVELIVVSLMVSVGLFKLELVLALVMEAVGWLVCGIGVMASSVGGGPWGGLFSGQLLEVVLSMVAVRRCRMLVAAVGFVPVLCCGAVGWQVWVALLVFVFM